MACNSTGQAWQATSASAPAYRPNGPMLSIYGLSVGTVGDERSHSSVPRLPSPLACLPWTSSPLVRAVTVAGSPPATAGAATMPRHLPRTCAEDYMATISDDSCAIQHGLHPRASRAERHIPTGRPLTAGRGGRSRRSATSIHPFARSAEGAEETCAMACSMPAVLPTAEAREGPALWLRTRVGKSAGGGA